MDKNRETMVKKISGLNFFTPKKQQQQEDNAKTPKINNNMHTPTHASQFVQTTSGPEEDIIVDNESLSRQFWQTSSGPYQPIQHSPRSHQYNNESVSTISSTNTVTSGSSQGFRVFFST